MYTKYAKVWRDISYVPRFHFSQRPYFSVLSDKPLSGAGSQVVEVDQYSNNYLVQTGALVQTIKRQTDPYGKMMNE